jgi:hypothetical protein
VQLGHDDFGGAAFWIVLVVPFDAGRNTAAVIGNRDGIVGMDGDVEVQCPASDSSIELSSTSNTRWCKPVPSDVSPMYMPGRLRTASRPSRIWMEDAPYCAVWGWLVFLVVIGHGYLLVY